MIGRRHLRQMGCVEEPPVPGIADAIPFVSHVVWWVCSPIIQLSLCRCDAVSCPAFCLTNAAGGIALVCCHQGFEGHNPDYGKIQAQVFAVANAQPCNTETDAHPPLAQPPGESLRPGCASGAFLCVLKVNLLVESPTEGPKVTQSWIYDIEILKKSYCDNPEKWIAPS